jgi:hypothetical protein
VVDVVGNDGAAAGDLVADEFGSDVVGDRGAEILAVANLCRDGIAAQVFADRDIFHLGRDDALAGIMHLRHVGAGFGAEHLAADVGEGGYSAGTVGAELAVILGLHLALGDFLDVAAGAYPVAAELGKARHDVDRGGGVGIGAGGVVDAERRFAAAGLKVDLAHRHAERADMDLAAAADRAGGDLELGAGGPFDFAQDR